MSEIKRLYKFYPADSGVRNLLQKRLKISRIHELNDPFESNPFRLQSETDREVWERTKGSLWKDKGLISFSEKNSNPLLWAHYAESHKGVCMGFDVSGANQIKYVSARRKMPSLLDIVKQKDTSTIEAAIMTKYWHWRYESEWRIIVSVDEVDNSGMSFLDFNDNLILKEVLVGYRSSLELKDFRKLVGPDVEIKRMRPAFNSFRVVTATRLVKK